MSESGVTVIARSGISTLPIGELAGKILTTVGVATTEVTSTAQTTCLAQKVYDLLGHWRRNKPKVYSVFPALATPTRITGFENEPITNKDDLVRHGILVKTYAPQYPDKPIYVYIGGVSSAWKNVDRLGVFRGGKAGYASTSIVGDQISYAANSEYPIIIAPVQYKLVSSRFVNPPNEQPCGQNIWNQAGGVLQSSSMALTALVPSYVKRIYNALSEFPSFYDQEPGRNRWYLDDSFFNVLNAMSGLPPLFHPALITMPQITGTIGMTSLLMNYETLIQFHRTEEGIPIKFRDPLPTLNGAPAFTANLCSEGCGLQLAGFVMAPRGMVLPTSTPGTYQVQLIAPPKDFDYASLRDYASQLGQVRWFDQLMERIFKAFDVVAVLTTTYGVPQSVAERAVEAIDWFGDEFAKSVQEIAQDIYNELNRPEHHADTHTDQAGQEVHNAYMCVRFGINCRE